MKILTNYIYIFFLNIIISDEKCSANISLHNLSIFGFNVVFFVLHTLCQRCYQKLHVYDHSIIHCLKNNMSIIYIVNYCFYIMKYVYQHCPIQVFPIHDVNCSVLYLTIKYLYQL